MNDAVEVVLFDFGGVLARFRGIEALAAWAGEGDVDRLWNHWLTSPTVRAFETGRLEPAAFAKRLGQELELGLAPEAILEDLREWVPHLLDGAEELLAELGDRRTALLSNTNSVHWPLYAETMTPYFECVFLSYETGRLKPDSESFLHVAETMACAPSAILFFDDSETNVNAARRAGLQAERTRSPAECRKALQHRGLLAHRHG
ncbi:MAG: HAD family phosphatase [Acidobacteriota bacterium]